MNDTRDLPKHKYITCFFLWQVGPKPTPHHHVFDLPITKGINSIMTEYLVFVFFT